HQRRRPLRAVGRADSHARPPGQVAQAGNARRGDRGPGAAEGAPAPELRSRPGVPVRKATRRRDARSFPERPARRHTRAELRDRGRRTRGLGLDSSGPHSVAAASGPERKRWIPGLALVREATAMKSPSRAEAFGSTTQLRRVVSRTREYRRQFGLGYVLAFWFRSLVDRVLAPVDAYLLRIEGARGILGPSHRGYRGHSPLENRRLWSAYDWSTGG